MNEGIEKKAKYNFVELNGSIYAKQSSYLNFGTTDFTEKYYVFIEEMYFLTGSILVNVYEKGINSPDDLPEWLLIIGSVTCDYFAFDSSVSLLRFIKTL